MNTQEALKRYIEDILSLNPIEKLSPAARLIYRLGEELLNQIGEDAGYVGQYKRFLDCFFDLTKKEKSNLSAEEAKVIKVITEGAEWIKAKGGRWDVSLSYIGLHGDEIFYALGNEITDPDVIKRFRALGIEI